MPIIITFLINIVEECVVFGYKCSVWKSYAHDEPAKYFSFLYYEKVRVKRTHFWR